MDRLDHNQAHKDTNKKPHEKEFNSSLSANEFSIPSINSSLPQARGYSKLIEGIKLEGKISLREIAPRTKPANSSSPVKSILQFNGTWQFNSALTRAMEFRYMTTSMFQINGQVIDFEKLPTEIKWKGNFENAVQGKINQIPENFVLECKGQYDNIIKLDGQGRNRFGDFHIYGDWDILSSKFSGAKFYFEKNHKVGVSHAQPGQNLFRSSSELVRISLSTEPENNIFEQRPTRMLTRRRSSLSRTTTASVKSPVAKKFKKNAPVPEKNKKASRGRPRKSYSVDDESSNHNASKDSKSMSEESLSKSVLEADDKDISDNEASNTDAGKKSFDGEEEEDEDIFLTLDTSSVPRIPRRQRTGFGIKASYTGFMYEGQWYKGKKHGKGIVYDIRNSGSIRKIFQGEFVDDMVTGLGTFIGDNGDRYDGEWANGSFNGFGEYFQSSESGDVEESQTYSGEWVRNVREGIGRITLLGSNAYYDGTWENDMFHGQGTLHVPNKISFNGEFENGVMEGKGVCFYYNKSGELVGKYDGGFKEGLRSGRGWYKFFSGGVAIGEFEGRFKNDEMESNNTIEVTENLPIVLSNEEWVLPLKRQSEMKFIHHASGFREDGS